MPVILTQVNTRNGLTAAGTSDVKNSLTPIIGGVPGPGGDALYVGDRVVSPVRATGARVPPRTRSDIKATHASTIVKRRQPSRPNFGAVSGERKWT
jgi:hypothetical protein